MDGLTSGVRTGGLSMGSCAVYAPHFKWKTLGFAIVIILGVGGLVAGGLGLSGHLQVGSLSGMGQITLIGSGVLFLIVGIVGSVKNCQQSKGLQIKPPMASFSKNQKQYLKRLDSLEKTHFIKKYALSNYLEDYFKNLNPTLNYSSQIAIDCPRMVYVGFNNQTLKNLEEIKNELSKFKTKYTIDQLLSLSHQGLLKESSIKAREWYEMNEDPLHACALANRSMCDERHLKSTCIKFAVEGNCQYIDAYQIEKIVDCTDSNISYYYISYKMRVDLEVGNAIVTIFPPSKENLGDIASFVKKENPYAGSVS